MLAPMRFIVPCIVGVALVAVVLLVYRREHSPRQESAPPLQRVWVFEAPRPGSVVATPCITRDSIFLAAAHTHGLSPYGAVYSVDPATGKQKWVFDSHGEMLPTASSPIVADGRVLVGEGMHANFSCRLRSLDSATGHEQWAFPANDHIEGGATVVGGRAIFPAGNDGLYAVDLASGKLRWNFRADLHIDSTPCVADGRVYCGSGKSRRFANFQVVCLDAATGHPIWRTPVDLPAWGTPVVAGSRLFIGLGNGRLNEPAQPPEKPAGALACFDSGSGKELWKIRTGDAVFGTPAVVADRVVFGSRDGNLYGASLDGTDIFHITIGGPVVGGIASDGRRAFAVSVNGTIVCVRSDTGKEMWRHELGQTDASPEVFASPVFAGNRLYVAAEMRHGGVGVISLFCFEITSRDGSDS
jgi:outer membrane protein assembly factor BamB